MSGSYSCEVASLDELARVLRGTVYANGGRTWVEATIGDLRAVVIERDQPLTRTPAFDVGVFTPTARERDIPSLHAQVTWGLRDDDGEWLPRVGNGFVFVSGGGELVLAR